MTDGRPATVAAVAESYVELQRMVRRTKARRQAMQGGDVESATYSLLHAVQSDGPLRASALATSVQSDLSTVSRQVTVLVNRGLLERRADQHDGRVCVLALTDGGRAAIAEHEQKRQTFFDDLLSGWGTDDMRRFAQQLKEFTAAYDHAHSTLMSKSTTPQHRKGTNA